jgi:hypothetical protein
MQSRPATHVNYSAGGQGKARQGRQAAQRVRPHPLPTLSFRRHNLHPSSPSVISRQPVFHVHHVFAGRLSRRWRGLPRTFGWKRNARLSLLSLMFFLTPYMVHNPISWALPPPKPQWGTLLFQGSIQTLLSFISFLFFPICLSADLPNSFCIVMRSRVGLGRKAERKICFLFSLPFPE